MMKRKNVIKCFILVFGVIAIINLFLNPFFKANNGIIKRNLANYSILINKEPDGRYVAWHSELPQFISEDINYAQKNGYEIEYTFFDTIIKIVNQDGVMSLKIDTVDLYDSINLYDFSIYKGNDDNLIIYGYNYLWDPWFEKITISKDDYLSNTLTYDTNLPFDQDSIGTTNIGEYSLLIKKESDENNKYRFLFYKDGKLVSITSFPKEVKCYNKYNGAIFTTDNELYMSYVKIEEDKPIAKFILVDKVDELIDMNSLSVDNISLPILKLNGEYYTISSNNWEIYKACSIGSELVLNKSIDSSNLDLELVNLKDIFTSAEFINDGDWSAKLQFNVNGLLAKYTYRINGYDSGVGIYTHEVEELSKTVNSLDEYWNHVEKIRETYAKRYDYPPKE